MPRTGRFVIALLLLITLTGARADRLTDRLSSIDGPHQARSLAEAKAMLDTLPQSAIAGIWHFTEGGTIAIIDDQASGDSYVVAIDSPSRNLMPGTIIGIISPTGKKDIYEARIYRRVDADGSMSRPARFTARLTDGNYLSLTAIHNSIKINPWRLIPYMFRGLITSNDNRPEGLDGAIRVYSPRGGKRVALRYL